MQYKLLTKDGEELILTGDHNAIVKLIRDLKAEYKPSYKSSSKGVVFIEDMHTSHIINAVLAKFRRYTGIDYGSYYGKKILAAFAQLCRAVSAYHAGTTFYDQELFDLGAELENRSK